MTENKILLRGITWDHARGHAPLVATALEYQKINPDVRIDWERRSLKSFEESPVSQLAEEYDLVVFDHPFVGDAAQNGPLLPLDEHLPEAFLNDQAGNAVGASHRSYTFAGHQWGLAIDAAAPVAFWREDLLEQHGLAVPSNWPELMRLARKGHVEIPAAPINCLMNFYTLCVALGDAPFERPNQVVSARVGEAALELLRELINSCDPGCLQRDPIASHELVASAGNTEAAYCPLAYGYSNYAREDFSARRLTFGPPPSFHGAALRTVLGGTGLGVSALRPNQAAAVAYAAFVASGEIQRTLYTRSGGQPGHRSAWLDDENNRITRDCFRRTLPTLDNAYLRPRYNGYMAFQEQAGAIVHGAVRRTISKSQAVAQLNAIYRDSQERTHTLV